MVDIIAGLEIDGAVLISFNGRSANPEELYKA